ncbi:DEAD/DEAH box helicase [Streptomyces glebosus]|uniref:DEAD/DEAH box helicase n=1 Tax=Streptomyces glebosus TaxID=249580 RepID=A0A640T645_9ACTN|nr:DEAD/DEAH box helicase [Streptomyces glebosus]GHG46757.1 DEAD/DEAH box helicase [Streptomyces glebosus]
MGSDAHKMNEDETCRAFVLPALASSKWGEKQIRSQYRINNGGLVPTRRRHKRGAALVADYVLEYLPDVPLAVVEAKRYRRNVNDGVEQARRYARKLGLSFAYATNGSEIVEISFGGEKPTIKSLERFPTPDELWARFLGEQGVLGTKAGGELLSAPYDYTLRNTDNTPKRPRYYQRVAVTRALAALARDERRILLVLATGTGKTLLALQLVARLSNAPGAFGGRKPRVLYLADRNMLVDDPKDRYFLPVFGEDDVHKIGGGEAKRGRKVYFALYQSLEQGEAEAELFRQYEPDYFDVVIVDECHRGSASSNSRWRKVLEHYSPAFQIGLTATPVKDDKKKTDTYEYFGNPVYTYSLRDGIQDGFLSPYRVRRLRLNVDMEGYRPKPGEQDIYGRVIPDDVYGPKDYERVMVILERTEVAAQYVLDHLRATAEDGLQGKTLVFCENNHHAGRMRDALFNAASEEVGRLPDYVVRITNADGDPGMAALEEFRKEDSNQPVVAVTSKLLSTGVDLPAVRNIVIFRRMASMPEFKQVIGRGTRLCPEIGKESFDIIDFVEATRLFDDVAFDGPALRVVEDTADEQGTIVDSEDVTPPAEEPEEPDAEAVAEPESPYNQEEGGSLNVLHGTADTVTDPDEVDRIRARGRRYTVKDVDVYKWGERRYQLADDGRSMRLVSIEQWVHDRVLELSLEPGELRTQWARAKSRGLLMEALKESDINAEMLPAEMGNPDVDPVDLLLNAAWGLPLVSRDERLVRFRKEHRTFLGSFTEQAREVLEGMLLKFAESGSPQLKAETLKVPPFSNMGRVVELTQRFGGGKAAHEALDELASRLLSVS